MAARITLLLALLAAVVTIVVIGGGDEQPKARTVTREKAAVRESAVAAEAERDTVRRLVDQLSDASTAEEAAEKLLRYRQKAAPAVPTLVRWLNGEGNASDAIELLTAIGPGAEDAVPHLQRYIEEMVVSREKARRAYPTRFVCWGTHPYPAMRAIEAIGKAGIPEMIEAIAHKSRSVRYHAGVVLQNLIPDSVPALIAATRDKNSRRREEAAEILKVAVPDHTEVFDAMLALLDDPERQVQRNAMETLAAFGARAAPVLAKALGSDDQPARRAAARAFEDSPEAARAAVYALANALLRDDASIREHCAEALAKIGKHAEPAKAELGAILGDKDNETGEAAVTALANIGTPAIPVLSQALASTDPLTRARATDALSRVPGAGASQLDIFLNSLSSPHKLERWNAAIAIARVGVHSDATLPVLRELFAKSDDYKQVKMAMQAVTSYRGRDAVAAIKALFAFAAQEQETPRFNKYDFILLSLSKQCGESIAALGASPGQHAPTALVAGLANKSENVRNHASAAVRKSRSPRFLAPLLKQAQNEWDRARERALPLIALFAKGNTPARDALELGMRDASWRVRIRSADAWFATFGEERRTLPITIRALHEVPSGSGKSKSIIKLGEYAVGLSAYKDKAAFAFADLEWLAQNAPNIRVRNEARELLTQSRPGKR